MKCITSDAMKPDAIWKVFDGVVQGLVFMWTSDFDGFSNLVFGVFLVFRLSKGPPRNTMPSLEQTQT